MQVIPIIQQIGIWAIPVLFAIIIHEVAHGWVAYQLGDPTAKNLGRLSLNPIKHIDPIGTLVVPILLLSFSNFLFGWAKPVPINWHNLRNLKSNIILVALAGPGSNFLMALFWALFAKISSLSVYPDNPWGYILYFMGPAGIVINLMLMVFNLLPVPPLDGSRVLAVFLKGKTAWYYSRLENFGFIIVALLVFTGLLIPLISPIIYGLSSLLGQLFNLPQMR